MKMGVLYLGVCEGGYFVSRRLQRRVFFKRETCKDKRWGIRNEKVVELATDGPARDNGGEVRN